MPEGVYELHWIRREYGQLDLTLYERLDHGQLRMVDKHSPGPFSPRLDAAEWLVRALSLQGPSLAV